MLMEPEPWDPQIEGVLNPAALVALTVGSISLPRLVARGNYSRIGVAPVVSTLAQTNLAWSATVRRSCKLRVMDDLYPNSSAKPTKERTFAFNLHVRTEWQQVLNKNGYPTRDSNSL